MMTSFTVQPRRPVVSVADRFTWYVPGIENRCVTTRPEPVLPSSKSHANETMSLSGSVDGPASSTTSSLIVGAGGGHEEAAARGDGCGNLSRSTEGAGF